MCIISLLRHWIVYAFSLWVLMNTWVVQPSLPPPIDVAPTVAAKPDCIEPAAGNRLADTAACVDHAQPAADKARTSVTDTLVILIVV